MKEMPPKTEIIKHIVEKNHDDWKFSIENVVGPTTDRHTIKVRGDDLNGVIADLKRLKDELIKPNPPSGTGTETPEHDHGENGPGKI